MSERDRLNQTRRPVLHPHRAADAGGYRAPPGDAVMTGENSEPGLQKHLGRTRRPESLALDLFQPLQMAAHIEKKAGEFRPHRLDRPVDPRPGIHGGIRQIFRAPAPPGPRRQVPSLGDRRHLGAPVVVGAQALGRFALLGRQEGSRPSTRRGETGHDPIALALEPAVHRPAPKGMATTSPTERASASSRPSVASKSASSRRSSILRMA